MKKEIVNFSEFFGERKKVSPIEKTVLEADNNIDTGSISQPAQRPGKEHSDIDNENIIVEKNEIEEYLEEEISEDYEIAYEAESKNDNYYTVFKDKAQDFVFDIILEGEANIENTEARLILESDDWSLVFTGDIDKKGVCTIPMKKLTILNEGVVGKIKVEVITDSTIFTPWEDEFKVKLSKKVSVKLNENKSIPKKAPVRSGVKINVNRQ